MRKLSLFHSLVQAFALFGLLAITGCTTTHLEFDRMTGTAFPQPQTVSGSSVSLQSIYLSADKLLVAEEDDTNIAPLTDGTGSAKQCITNSELSSLMTANRGTQIAPASFDCGFWIFKATCTRYHAYGIVVDHYATYSTGNCKTSTIGRMWRTADRSGFAIFYKNSVPPGNAEQYLLATVHELGHAFNLHHEDSDGSKSIMTGTIDSTYEFKFSNQSETHLKDHPDDCAYPGNGSFYSVNTSHTNHSYVTQDCGID